MILRPYQSAAVEAIFEEWKTHDSTMIVCPTGCHEPSQEVMCADGSIVRADEIVQGMSLMGTDGTPRTVLAVHRGKNRMVKVIPTKGEPFVVTLNHPLTLIRTNEKKKPKYKSWDRGGEIIDVPVGEWMKWSKWKKHIHKLFRVPLDFKNTFRPCDSDVYPHPYLIGVLLGDGCLGKLLALTSMDLEVVSEVSRLLVPFRLYLQKTLSTRGGKASSYVLQSTDRYKHDSHNFRKWLALLGINKTISGNKFIPDFYKLGSRESRREILAGLMDTDGSVSGSGYDYISKSKRLADDVSFIARSLGLAAYVKPCRKSCQTGATGTYYRVSLSGDCSVVPCRIPRKACSVRRQKKNVLRMGFSVELLEEGDFVGFTVDGDNRYLLADFMVTHNTGKTQIFTDVIRRTLPGRSLVLAHRTELILQSVERIESFGLDAQIEMADQVAGATFWSRSPVIVASIQTLISGNGNGKRMERFNPDEFAAVIVDEAHHSTSASYRSVLGWFRRNPALKILGVTATPDRADEEALGQIFQSVAYDYEILDAIHDGWLVPVDQQIVTIEGLDFSAVRTTAGDLNGADLAAVMEAEKNMQGVAGAVIKIVGGKRTLVFTASVKQAEVLSDIFNRHRPGMAGWICGKTPKEERRKALAEFKSGAIQVMANCAVLGEGWDGPEVEVVVQARPTKSRCLYAQQCGRGLRPLTGIVDGLDTAEERKAAIEASGKKSILIIDFVGNSGKHKLITTADILGGKVSDEAIEAAAAKAKAEGRPVRMDELLDEEDAKIKQEAEERRLADRARKARLVAGVRFGVHKVDPFGVLDIAPAHDYGWGRGKTISEKQRNLLLKQGIDPDGMPYNQAQQLIGTIIGRWNQNLCTIRQAAVLKKHGYETRDLPMAEASKLIDALAKNGWRRPNAVAVGR